MAGCNVLATIILYSTLIFCLQSFVSGYHLPEWSWESGSSRSDQISVISENGSFPGGRMESTGWVDTKGSLWVYGGKGKGFERSRKSTPYNLLDDLWKYNISSKAWTLIASQLQKDIKDPSSGTTDVPPPLCKSVSCSYQDMAVLFGGLQSNDIASNETWILNMTSHKWSFLNTSHCPGLREGAAFWCSGEIMWIFGGANKNDFYSDMWKFSLVKKQWQKQHLNADFPSPRKDALAWPVPGKGKFYLFGGQSDTRELLSDLWVYTVFNNTWLQLQRGGMNTHGVYGQIGNLSSTTYPGCRSGSATWTDFNGNLWLFGGSGYDSENSLGYLSDLWMFDTSCLCWSWMGGEKRGELEPHYPRQYEERNITNLPGPRSNAISYTSEEDMWLFSGVGHDISMNDGCLNDLWRLDFGLPHELAVKPEHPLSGNSIDISLSTRIAVSVIVLFATFVFTLLVCYRTDFCRKSLKEKNAGPRVKYERVGGVEDVDIHTTA